MNFTGTFFEPFRVFQSWQSVMKIRHLLAVLARHTPTNTDSGYPKTRRMPNQGNHPRNPRPHAAGHRLRQTIPDPSRSTACGYLATPTSLAKI